MTDTFNCPKCGAHDYGLYAAGLLPCPHCQARELAEARATIAGLRKGVPYREFCRHPDKCAGLGSCPRDPTCAD